MIGGEEMLADIPPFDVLWEDFVIHLPHEYSQEYLDYMKMTAHLIYLKAKNYNINPRLLWSIAYTESDLGITSPNIFQINSTLALEDAIEYGGYKPQKIIKDIKSFSQTSVSEQTEAVIGYLKALCHYVAKLIKEDEEEVWNVFKHGKVISSGQEKIMFLILGAYNEGVQNVIDAYKEYLKGKHSLEYYLNQKLNKEGDILTAYSYAKRIISRLIRT